VISEDLPPLIKKYGDRINILGINVTTQDGQNLYRAAVEYYNIPDERLGVPCLIVGETVLVGSQEIPDQFPGIIEAGLAAGGIAWPGFPGLDALLSTDELSQPSHGDSTTGQRDKIEPVNLWERFSQDSVGNSLAVIVLIGLIASIAGSSYRVIQSKRKRAALWPEWIIPVLLLIGLGVAVYLSYIELTRSEAICGPVGDCNAVQQSPYARLFGLLPVGVLGVIGYLSIGAIWMLHRYRVEPLKRYAALAIWGLAAFGVLFSIYLTILEPFVIGATCIWCLTSAVVMVLILWASTEPAAHAWKGITSTSA
jgi:uncharacterized membrane protein